ncbi:MAG: 50S ribosomal protein L10 [Methanocellales archaeon]|nr:50S ribosomal protein L10 [Methanocellales archaeon]MDD3291834.1 50S ribosomal protein L10 [Methanocellales archaeon]MDD5234552.1 50S ribosomal protein L10 [Methanocellales archaeon]MDD5485096.1 50S ribosomal protein L10 [Methanocellales archaeon]
MKEWKKEEIEGIKQNIQAHSMVGLVGMRGMPAKQLQSMRRDLRGTAILKMSRNTLIKRALEESDKKIRPMGNFIEDQTALIFSEIDPFKLYRLIEKSKLPSPAKPGDLPPKDILVEKGPTSFKPGPIVGELQNAGISAAIEGGKVVIRETKIVAKKGEPISPKLAEMLRRLEIHPMEVGLDLRAAYENGIIYEVLAIDELKYFSDFTSAVQNAFNLAISLGYPNKATIHALLSKASTGARNLAIKATIFEPDVMESIIYKAYAQVTSLSKLIEKKGV